MKHNLIIVDDHKMFLDGLRSIFEHENDYQICFTSKSAAAVIKYVEANPPSHIDLVITDLSMPEIDGVTLNTQLKAMDSQLKTLVVSMHYDPEVIDTLIEHDVDGYLSKNAQKEELLLAVQTLLKGGKYFSKEIKDIYTHHKFTQKKEQEVKLTRREIDVITLIAKEYTTKEIADKLYLSKHTIESYRKNLIAKLNVRNLAGLTRYALKKKYIQL